MKIDWEKVNDLVPAIIQDYETAQVLMLGYMNKQALAKTVATEKVHFYSRSKQRLWLKGETSGNFLLLKDIELDCDNDALLITVKPTGPVCHNGTYSCFKNSIGNVFAQLFQTLKNRKKNKQAKSYTVALLQAGVEKICAKVEEESLEVIQAATKETKQRLAEETADLIYHNFVLLLAKGVDLRAVMKVLQQRNSSR